MHRGKRWRMQVVVDQLREAETDELRAVLLGFVNSLVHGAEGLEERCAIRDEIVGEGGGGASFLFFVLFLFFGIMKGTRTILYIIYFKMFLEIDLIILYVYGNELYDDSFYANYCY